MSRASPAFFREVWCLGKEQGHQDSQPACWMIAWVQESCKLEEGQDLQEPYWIVGAGAFHEACSPSHLQEHRTPAQNCLLLSKEWVTSGLNLALALC